jgi:hypothetical protein
MKQTQPPSPKIYFLQRIADSKFYNSRQKTYFTSPVNANYERDRKGIEFLINTSFKEHQVYETTEDEFWELMAMTTSDLVIAGSYFAERLNNLACIIPTISQVNKTTYQKCKNAIEALKPFTKWKENFLASKEETTDDVSGLFSEMLFEFGKVEVYEAQRITAVLQAYKKDRESIMGITKKILR